MECNKITINGEEFFFIVQNKNRRLLYDSGIHYFDIDETTYFYKETKESIYKPMFSFKTRVNIIPIFLFGVSYNILSPEHSKWKVTSSIKAAYKEWVDITKRKKEIANCEIIDEIKL